MKKKNKQMTTLAILLVAVVGLSIGFAAFSNILTISSGATVTPDESTFNVDFSTNSTSVVAGTIEPVDYPDEGVTAENAIIDNTGNPTIKNIKATFTEPGITASYTFYAYNAGEYAAYLNKVNFLNVEGKNEPKVCTPASGTTQALVDEACKGIVLSISIDGMTYTNSQDVIYAALDKNKSHKIVVSISYSGARADGEFTVEFGDISLTYSTVNIEGEESQFTVANEDGSNSKTYTYEKGMTWAAWIESSYNVDGWTVDLDGNVMTDEENYEWLSYNVDQFVHSNWLIDETADYMFFVV